VEIIVLTVKPYTQPYFPQQPGNWYVYNGNSVDYIVVVAIIPALSVPILFAIHYWIVGYVYPFRKSVFIDDSQPQQPSPLCKVISAGRLIAVLLCAIMFCQASTDMTKLYIGELRPGFGTLCMGSVPPETYTPTVISSNAECPALIALGNGTQAYHDLDHQLDRYRLSFPSGHTSMVITVFACLSFYFGMLAKRLSTLESRLALLLHHVARLVSVTLPLWSWMIGMSRIHDYAHHYWDVLGGVLLGLFSAITLFVPICMEIFRDAFYQLE